MPNRSTFPDSGKQGTRFGRPHASGASTGADDMITSTRAAPEDTFNTPPAPAAGSAQERAVDTPKFNAHGHRRMQDSNIFEVIDRALPALRRGSRQMAAFVLAHPQFVIGASLADLAREVAVSEPTVLRFCSTVGCSGFRELKIRVAQSLALGAPATHSALTDSDDPRTVATKILDFTITSLDWTRSRLDPAAVEAAVEMLSRARRIEFFGFGASGIVAFDAQQKFPLFGVPCGASQDPHQQFITASMLREGDVVVAISNTGTTRSLLEVTRVAKLHGATVVVITGAQSPICLYGDVVVIAESLDNTDLYTPTISRISALVVIDILSTSVALRKGEQHARAIGEMKKGLSGSRSTGLL
jgi:RpiR family carbohydrate utilization transcriptional regulator